MGKRQRTKRQQTDLNQRQKFTTRPAERVTGRKAVWALVIGINFVGPIAYFIRGRHPRG